METPERPTAPVVVSEITKDGEMRVIRILPDAKYAIVLPEKTTHEELERYIKSLDLWTSAPDSQFMILHGVKLVRVDEEDPDDSAHPVG